MIYIARDFLSRLRHLVLSGQNEDGELEWIGTDKQWRAVQLEEALNQSNLFTPSPRNITK